MSLDAPTDLVDRIFGERYRVIESIGLGAVSRVYLAEDSHAGERVAIKVFDQTVGEDPDIADRLLGRIAEVARVEHPSMVRPLDWGRDGVRIWIVSELCRGGSLRDMLDRGNTLSPSQALVVSLELARCLAQVHGVGLTHRGIKPENILFSEDQRLRVSDFGLVDVLANAPSQRPAKALDRVRYLAPEQAAGRPVGSPVDLYSLALVCNEAVTGRAPAEGETVVSATVARAESPAVLGVELAELRGPLERAGRLDPGDRPEADELAISLLAAAETMSRPGPLPLAGLSVLASTSAATGAEPVEAVPPIANAELTVGPSSSVDDPSQQLVLDLPGATPLDFDIPEAEAPSSPLVDPGLVLPEYVEPEGVQLSLVPEVEPTGMTERVALEDLELAEPVFASEADEAQTLDVPASAQLPQRSVFRPDADDLDDSLPMWPLALLAGICAAIVVVLFLFSGGGSGAVTAPDVVGLDESQLADVAVDGGFELRRLEARRNGTTPGTVISQKPDPGFELVDGEPLTVTVSLGSEMIEIPGDLPGLSVEQAGERLRVSGLELGSVTTEPNESLDTGLVIAVDEPTRQKPAGETVALRVSSGPEDRAVPTSLIGTAVADAMAELAGLRLQGVEEQVYDEIAEPGTVLGSEPAAGSTVPADSPVTLFVSAGPEPIEMPDLADLTLAEAADRLEELGLIFADTQGTPGEPVIGTIPSAGETVDVGSEVIIVLAEEGDDEGDEPADAG